MILLCYLTRCMIKILAKFEVLGRREFWGVPFSSLQGSTIKLLFALYLMNGCSVRFHMNPSSLQDYTTLWYGNCEKAFLQHTSVYLHNSFSETTQISKQHTRSPHGWRKKQTDFLGIRWGSWTRWFQRSIPMYWYSIIICSFYPGCIHDEKPYVGLLGLLSKLELTVKCSNFKRADNFKREFLQCVVSSVRLPRLCCIIWLPQ